MFKAKYLFSPFVGLPPFEITIKRGIGFLIIILNLINAYLLGPLAFLAPSCLP